MEIVPVEKIPKELKPLPDNPLEAYRVSLNMAAFCDELGGMGLHAVQIGIPYALFVKKNADKYEVYGSCRYYPETDSKKLNSIEGCLSLGKSRYILERYDKVFVKGKRLNEKSMMWEDFSVSAKGVEAVVFQHEIDHELGELIMNKGKEIKVSL